MRTLYFGQSISELKVLPILAHDSKISASYDTSNLINGATVFFQPESNPNEIQYETIDRTGKQLQSGVVN